MKGKKQNISFEDYFENLKTSHVAFRDEICEKLNISKETFYLRKKTGNWTYPEKVVISQLTGIAIDDLWPEKKP